MHTYISAQAWLWVAAAQAGAESVREGRGGGSLICLFCLSCTAWCFDCSFDWFCSFFFPSRLSSRNLRRRDKGRVGEGGMHGRVEHDMT